jgi:hypothetical protein
VDSLVLLFVSFVPEAVSAKPEETILNFKNRGI